MSSLWTPGGERPIRRDPPADQSDPDDAPGKSAEAEPTPDEIRAEMAELQEQLARTPADVVIANHAFGLFELAALHLSRQPPQLDQARLAIDAMAALVEGLGDRLGEHAAQLSDGLAQLRMAYVQIHGAQLGDAAGAPAAGGNGTEGPASEPPG
jgi:hypothetical protein